MKRFWIYGGKYKGEYVDAEIAEELYDTLEDVTGEAAFEGLPEDKQERILKVLAKADKEDT